MNWRSLGNAVGTLLVMALIGFFCWRTLVAGVRAVRTGVVEPEPGVVKTGSEARSYGWYYVIVGAVGVLTAVGMTAVTIAYYAPRFSRPAGP